MSCDSINFIYLSLQSIHLGSCTSHWALDTFLCLNISLLHMQLYYIPRILAYSLYKGIQIEDLTQASCHA